MVERAGVSGGLQGLIMMIMIMMLLVLLVMMMPVLLDRGDIEFIEQ